MLRTTLSLFVLLSLCLAGTSWAQGIMMPRDPSLPAMRLIEQEVKVDIRDHGAVTHVSQVFQNPTSQQLEAVFYFPIPEGATTTDFALWMNGERIRGEVLPRAQARATYESIVRRMRDPGLLEYVDAQLFQASIYPVPPNGTQKVEIQYAATLQEQNGSIRYTLPIHESTQRQQARFTVSGTVSSSIPLVRVYSPDPLLDVHTINPSSARFGFESSGEEIPKSIELFMTRSADDVGISLLTWEGDGGRNEAGYFMLTLSPTEALKQLRILPKQITFVLDTSGSMRGVKWDQAVQALLYGINALRSEDTFNVIGFSTGVTTAFERPIVASDSGKQRGRDFVNDLMARGNTNISGALDAALAQPEQAGRPHTILFITDGLPTEGITAIPELLRHAEQGLESDQRRLFAFGVGYDVHTTLLDGLADKGRGRSDYVRTNEKIQDKLGPLVDRISSPLLTNLSLDFGSAEVTEMYPSAIPDLYQGESVTIFGRYKSSVSATVRVRGFAGNETWTRRATLRFGEDGGAQSRLSFIGNLWANRRVADLLRDVREQGETPTRVEEIVALASRWTIVTPYTSYLALDPSEVIDRPTPIGIMPEPNPVPMPRPSHPNISPRSEASRGSAAADLAYAPAPSVGRSAPASSVGRAAVEESLAMGEMERSERTTSVATSTTVQHVAGRRFDRRGDVWVESGVSGTVDQRVTYMSDAWFTLQRRSADVRAILALGEKVRFRVGSKVIEVVP